MIKSYTAELICDNDEGGSQERFYKADNIRKLLKDRIKIIKKEYMELLKTGNDLYCDKDRRNNRIEECENILKQ